MHNPQAILVFTVQRWEDDKYRTYGATSQVISRMTHEELEAAIAKAFEQARNTDLTIDVIRLQ